MKKCSFRENSAIINLQNLKITTVKDSRGNNNSGGTSRKFQFFEELNEIFSESHANSLPGSQKFFISKSSSSKKTVY